MVSGPREGAGHRRFREEVHLEDQVLSLAISWAVPALLAAGCGWVGVKLRGIARSVGALMDGMRSMLRCELVRCHERYVVRGEPVGLSDLEYVKRTYESYHGIDGNGIGTSLYEEIVQRGVRKAE